MFNCWRWWAYGFIIRTLDVLTPQKYIQRMQLHKLAALTQLYTSNGESHETLTVYSGTMKWKYSPYEGSFVSVSIGPRQISLQRSNAEFWFIVQFESTAEQTFEFQWFETL